MEDTVLATNTSRIPRQYGSLILYPGVPQAVPVSFVEMFGHNNIVYDFSRVQDLLTSHTDDGRLKIDWQSPLSAVDGYGRHSIWLIRALQRAGVAVSVRDVGWVDVEWMPPDIQQARFVANTVLPSYIGVTYTLGYDPHLYENSSLIKIGITQFETDTLPAKHVSHVNQLDHCVVTSSFHVKVFRKSGVTVPISVMTPGIEVDEFPYKERTMDGQFRVLILGALTPRKNAIAAIRVFQKASQGNPDWRLTIKSRPHADRIEEVSRAAEGDSRITMVLSEDDPRDVVKHYHAHHCFLWTSKGEGLGIPPLEAMATGMELVCSDNSGMSDYVSDEICYPVKMAGMEPASGPGNFSDRYIRNFGPVGKWWTPDEDHAIRQLQRCFDRWIDGKGKGKKAAQIVREKFTVDRSVADLIEVIDRYA